MKLILFRFHRGGLSESMETVIEVKTFEHLIMHIQEHWEVQPAMVSIDPYMYDARIDWDTQIVQIAVGIQGRQVIYPVGFLNRAPTEWNISPYEQRIEGYEHH